MRNLSNLIELRDHHGKCTGYIQMSWYIPAFMLLEGKLYQRYGEVSRYYYVHEPEVFIPNEGEMVIERA